jgi:hypothetical protein
MERGKTVVTQEHRAAEHSGCVQKRRNMPGTPWCRYGVSLVLALALAIMGCGGDDDNFNLTGTWAGTVQDSVAGVGTILFTFSQTDGQVTGTWQIVFQNTTNNNGGTLSGSVSEPAITLVLSASRSQACSFTVAANNDGDDHVTGTYTALNCDRSQSGTLDVRRQ